VHEGVKDVGADHFDLVGGLLEVSLEVGYLLLEELHVYFATVAGLTGGLVVAGAGGVGGGGRGASVSVGERGYLGCEGAHALAIFLHGFRRAGGARF
jgi:hypothetical protein